MLWLLYAIWPRPFQLAEFFQIKEELKADVTVTVNGIPAHEWARLLKDEAYEKTIQLMDRLEELRQSLGPISELEKEIFSVFS